jgi:hypothetical protein
MPDKRGITEVTAIELAVIDDRLHFTVVSGERREPYSISFHRARNVAMSTVALLNKQDRKSADCLRRIGGGAK